ncbi:prepilin-type N-terminal cleavage/methylation domain-containing protein [Pseudomonas sp. 21LCFQ02]|uniref:prepilin-type N-terminal cleavage/methylation domain-containing protein n=1 Tax=Pseudomonas sp. 21LCFQ02 TaxID=2957505 RepID=UPI00209BB73F|nr:prepilin-type N-terminal cleavage/methylation domain-containing protein [Pseudomonas sp. 21LCFQ02]
MTRSHGFSLLELMVVLLIVGLFSGLSVAWLNGGPGAALQALDQLAAQAQQQAAVARHSGQLSGLRWNGHQPEFVRWQQGQWRVEPWRSSAWPQALRADWPASGEPRVIFTPAGVASPVNLRWQWPDGQQNWRWGSDNRLLRGDAL